MHWLVVSVQCVVSAWQMYAASVKIMENENKNIDLSAFMTMSELIFNVVLAI